VDVPGAGRERRRPRRSAQLIRAYDPAMPTLPDSFRAFVVDKAADGDFSRGLRDVDISQLPPGEVTVRVAWSSVNYKDALAARPDGRVARAYPLIPGIDLAGTVVQVGVPTPDMPLPDIPMIDFFGRGGALKPSWYGESVGHYEGDELVVDTIGLNDRTFVDNYRTPHTEQLHVVERFHRTDRDNMAIAIQMEDPKALAKPWETELYFQLKPDWDIMELVCTDNGAFEDFEK